jgi:hypothetical protein
MASPNERRSTDPHSPTDSSPPDRRLSFSHNPSFSMLFGSNRVSSPQTTTDPSLQRRVSWSYVSAKESPSVADDPNEIVTLPVDGTRRGSEIGRRLSTTANSIREALGFKIDELTDLKITRVVMLILERILLIGN